MQNCRNNNPYMRRANCGCGNNNNSCNSNSCMANNDGRNLSMSAPVYRERSGCSDRDDALDGMPIAMAYVPCQEFAPTFELKKALQVGTIFPELCKPFCGRRGGRR